MSEHDTIIDASKRKRGRPAVISGDKSRLNLSLSPASAARLEHLMEKTEATSYVEVFRNAMRLYDALIEEADKGNEFLVRDKDGNLTSYKLFY